MAFCLFQPEFSSVRLIECSPPSWMVRLVLEEKRLDYRLEQLSFTRGEHKTPEMLARNPRGTIPVLSDGQINVYETFAILEYLEATHPNPSLLPADTPEMRALALTRFHESANLKDLGMELFAYLMRTDPAERDGAYLDDLEEDFGGELQLWDDFLDGADYLVADRLSLADLSVFTYLATAHHLGKSLDRFPNLQRFYKTIAARRSVKETWPSTWTKRLDVLG